VTEAGESLQALASLLDAAGSTAAGDLAPVLELLTVDDDGFPFSCLLARRQLVIERGRETPASPEASVFALLSGRRPNAHLASRPRASLVFVVDDAHVVLRLEVVESRPLAGATVWTFRPVGGSLDRRAAVLVPIAYRAEDLDAAEGAPLLELLRDVRG
jgi:hypothetical protein